MAKSEGRPWVDHCIEQCIKQCLKQCLAHHPEPRSGLCPELLADFRIPKPPGCSQGAQRAVSCAVRVADFLAEGAGWGASPGRGGELGCQAKKVIAAVEFELKLLDQVEVSAVWIPHSLGAFRIGRDAGGEAVREREPRVPKPPGCSQGAQRAVFCAV